MPIRVKIPAKYISTLIFCSFFLAASFCLNAQVTANFSYSATVGCTPLYVQFNDLSTGSPTEWFWDFGNGITSTVPNPVVAYTTGGQFSVKLIVRNATSQDIKEYPQLVTAIATPQASFSSTPDSGCIPLNVKFNNTTETFGTTITNWLWSFGDGSTSSDQSPSYTYTSAGIFDVSLTAQNAEGCTNTYYLPQAIKTGVPPKAEFTVTPLEGCGSLPRIFTDLSTGNLTSWFWDFGDTRTSEEQNPQHFFLDTGKFTIKLTVRDNGCEDSAIYEDFLHVAAPVAAIQEVVNCDSPYIRGFRNRSIGGRKPEWDFGDGSPKSTQNNPQHTYSSLGGYVVKLKVTGDTCNDAQTDSVYIIDEHPSVIISPFKSSYCKSDSILLQATDYDTLNAKSYAWDFDDGNKTVYSSLLSAIYHVYRSAGTYRPKLYFRDKSNCVDTIELQSPIIISGPTAEFENPLSVCFGTPVTFTDKSQSGNNNSISSYVWSYGDGLEDISTSSSVKHNYSFPAQYNVNLKVIDENGCADSIMHTVSVEEVPLVDAGLDTTICYGESVTLNATGTTTYNWDFNEGLSCTNCSNPTVRPQTSTIYYVNGRNEGQCSGKDSVQVNVIPKPNLIAQPISDTICEGNSITLNASGLDIYSWSPSTGLSNDTSANPTASPLSDITYTVIGRDAKGCFSDTAEVFIKVKPKPSVDILNNTIVLLAGSSAQIKMNYGTDVYRWTWYPATHISCTDCAEPFVNPVNNTTYRVTVEGRNGCSNKDSVSVLVMCDKTTLFMPNTFSPNMDGKNDRFFPRSNVSVTIKSLRVFNRWGEKVFENTNFPTNNSSYGWDGRFKDKPVRADTYIYLMEIICPTGTVYTQNGNVTLIR